DLLAPLILVADHDVGLGEIVPPVAIDDVEPDQPVVRVLVEDAEMERIAVVEPVDIFVHVFERHRGRRGIDAGHDLFVMRPVAIILVDVRMLHRADDVVRGLETDRRTGRTLLRLRTLGRALLIAGPLSLAGALAGILRTSLTLALPLTGALAMAQLVD